MQGLSLQRHQKAATAKSLTTTLQNLDWIVLSLSVISLSNNISLIAHAIYKPIATKMGYHTVF